jgi:hypothetical protein
VGSIFENFWRSFHECLDVFSGSRKEDFAKAEKARLAFLIDLSGSLASNVYRILSKQ